MPSLKHQFKTWARRAATLALAVGVVVPVPGHAVPGRSLGDSRVIARVPQSPGFPEGVAVEGRTMYVSAPAQSGNFGDAFIYAFSVLDGSLLRTLPIHPIVPGRENGFAGVALDGSGSIYAAGQQGVVRLNLTTGAQSAYASIPDLPPCAGAMSGPCSPTASDRPPFPNDPTFDSSGFLYVTDSFQATVWRIPPGGGSAVPWCQHPAFDAATLGPNGARMHPDGSAVAITVSGPPGGVYILTPVPEGCDVTKFHDYGDDLPDGLSFGKSGRLYVVLAAAGEVSVLDESGTEVARYAGPAASQSGDVPWDAPASAAFDNAGARLLVANHALVTGALFPQRFVVFDVFVDDRGEPLARPKIL